MLVTKYRRECLSVTMLDRFKEICLRLCKKWEVGLDEFGGEADHVHLPLDFHPTITPSKFVNNLKTVTSRLIRKEFANHMKSHYWKKPALWTRAYCLITAGRAPLEILKEYIQKQKRPEN